MKFACFEDTFNGEKAVMFYFGEIFSPGELYQ